MSVSAGVCLGEAAAFFVLLSTVRQSITDSEMLQTDLRF